MSDVVTFHIVKKEAANYHVRIVGENGEPVFWTENYTTRFAAMSSIVFITSHFSEETSVVIQNIDISMPPVENP